MPLSDPRNRTEEDRFNALLAEFATKQPNTGNTFAVASLPAAASNVGRCVYVTDGSAGSPCAAISDGTNWKVIAIGATVSAT